MAFAVFDVVLQIFVDGIQWQEIKSVVNELLDLYGLETSTNVASLSS